MDQEKYLRDGRTRLRVQRQETMSSVVLETLSCWLFRLDQASMLASSARIDPVFEAGTTLVTSSAYFINALPTVHTLKSDVLMMNIGRPSTDPWTTPAFSPCYMINEF